MCCNVGFSKNIPHPKDFKGSEQEKKNIISFIEKMLIKFIVKMNY